jgi:uncharacterized protein YjbJ (UPF0337 family)
MKPSTKDQIEGKLHEMKGTAKEKVGKITNDPNLAAKGQDEKFAGKVQKKVGQVEKVLGKSISQNSAQCTLSPSERIYSKTSCPALLYRITAPEGGLP